MIISGLAILVTYFPVLVQYATDLLRQILLSDLLVLAYQTWSIDHPTLLEPPRMETPHDE